jgi:hypothetical protein
MNRRVTLGFLFLVLISALIMSCGNDSDAEAGKDVMTAPAQESNTAQTEEPADVVTTASIVNTEEAFLEAISSEGTWIIATLTDLSFDQELVLEGAFTNRDVPARKIALYTQDADRNVTNRFILAAPKLTVRSESARIQGGTFRGDVYVEAPNFLVTDAVVEGDIYFASQEYRDSFKVDENAQVTGELITQ